VTALAYVLTLETPLRFARSRDVGPYLGLAPKQEDSGDCQPPLGISKAGDRMLRKLLVGSAHYILGPFGRDTDLRRSERSCVRVAERTLRNERPLWWHENSQFYYIGSGSAERYMSLWVTLRSRQCPGRLQRSRRKSNPFVDGATQPFLQPWLEATSTALFG